MILARRKELAIAYRNTFESPEGKRVLADLRKHAPLLTAPLGTTAGLDVNSLLVMEGQSNILKHIYYMLRRDPNEDRPEQALNQVIGE